MTTRTPGARKRLMLIVAATVSIGAVWFVFLPDLKLSTPAPLPPRNTCAPSQAWSSNAQCFDVTLESDLQWFEGYTLESGVPTRDFCRSFFNASGQARDKSCSKPTAYKKVACKGLGVSDGASCFVCDGKRDDERLHHLRAFMDDCSLGLSIKAVNVELNDSMCDTKLSPLCNSGSKARSDSKE